MEPLLHLLNSVTIPEGLAMRQSQGLVDKAESEPGSTA